jgi:hypothetical protein
MVAGQKQGASSVRKGPALLAFGGTIALAFALLSGCVSAPGAAGPGGITSDDLGVYRTPEAARRPPTADELAVIASAKTLVGQPPDAHVVVNGKPFILDCIGTVRAIYYKLYIDVAKDFDRFPGNGVNRLYMSLREKKVLHGDKRPRPGDVVIWDNTYDANQDGDRTDDLRTHAGVVLAVDDDGTIYYAHEHLRKGVIIEVMNLEQPTMSKSASGKLINSPLAMAAAPGQPRAERSLSGDLFKRFGDVLRLKDYFLDRAAMNQTEGREEPPALALAAASHGAAPAPAEALLAAAQPLPGEDSAR